MKGPLIRSAIETFKEYLKSPLAQDDIFVWECLFNFQNNWDLSELDLYSTYKKSFTGSISNRLWIGEQFDPKKIMLEFIRLDKEFVRSMFRDLYNESKDLMMRINRFLFHCDSLLEELKLTDQRFNTHYHDNYKMISIYLAFQYPEMYTIYEYQGYRGFMKKVGALKEPLANELPKFYTIMKSMKQNYLSKDNELSILHESRFHNDVFFSDNNLLLVYSFYHTIIKENST